MPLKTVFLFLFFFFFNFLEKAEWRHFTQILVDAEIKAGRRKGCGEVIKPLPPSHRCSERVRYWTAFCHKFPLEDISETGSFSESRPCLPSHLLTLLAAPHLHITSMGGEGGVS